MNDFGENVRGYLLQLKAMPANQVTHTLKLISGSEDGTMIDGVIKIATTAFFDGCITTAVVGAVVGSIFWIHSKHREKKKHEEECQKIIKTFENEIALGKSDTNSIGEKTCSNTDNPIIDG